MKLGLEMGVFGLLETFPGILHESTFLLPKFAQSAQKET